MSAILEPLPIRDAQVCYLRSMELGDAPSSLLDQLIHSVPWRAESIVLWGKTYPQPRLIAWHGDIGRRYIYSGITLEPLPWTDLLRGLKHRVERLVDESFNSVLLNYYRDGRDSIGFHSDDEPELGPAPTIASLSLGEVRTFVMKHRLRKDVPAVRVRLESGSLLLMKGPTKSTGSTVSRRRSAPRARGSISLSEKFSPGRESMI